MKTTHRGYSDAGGDFDRLARFVVEHNAAVREYSTWCLGRLVDWRYAIFSNKQPIEAFCDANARLWFDGFGDLAGFAVSENGDGGFAVITTAGYRFLFEEMLSWVLGAWADRGNLSIEVTAAQGMEIEALRRGGFERVATFQTTTYDLTQPLPARLPLEEGFTIVDMASHPDYRGQRVLRAEAFSGQTGLSDREIDEDLARRAVYHAGPTYHAPTDLCVMAPDGTLVSGCEALIDARNVEADVERVCTHSAYRRRGFARAVIHECLFRLQAMGIRRAAITGYSAGAIALYASFGAEGASTSYVYERQG